MPQLSQTEILILVGVLGYLSTKLQSVFSLISKNILDLFLTNLHIHSSDNSYEYFLDFIEKHKAGFVFKNFKFGIKTKISGEDQEGEWTHNIGYGYSLIKYEKNWILIHHEKTESTANHYYEIANLYLYYIGNVDLIKKIINRLYYLSSGKDKCSIYINSGSNWNFLTIKKKRHLNTIFWNDNLKEELLLDIETFQQAKETYQNKGIPYKRAYLLYGKPGTGKTSAIQSIAGYFNYNLAIMNLSTVSDDNELIKLFSTVPKQTILLLEDIDLMFQKLANPDDKKEDEKNRITFSGLLNSLDGVTSKEGLITFMTTNYVERLDVASIRSGRIDKKINIEALNKNSAKKMLDLHNVTDNYFLDNIQYPINPSDLQNSILELRKK